MEKIWMNICSASVAQNSQFDRKRNLGEIPFARLYSIILTSIRTGF